MSEEIIIDGVNVAECMFYFDNTCRCMDSCFEQDFYTCPQCKDVKNCYYKQLKRLQAENKRLQMLSCANCGEKYLSPDGAELYEKNVQLKAENEQLKALCDTYFTCYRAKHNDIEGNLFSYRKALEEIREIIRFPLYTNSTKPLSEIDFLINLVNEFEKNREKIINKINEVLKDER